MPAAVLRRFFLSAVLLLSTGCATLPRSSGTDIEGCAAAASDESGTWVLRTDPVERRSLDRWCAAVGPPEARVGAPGPDRAIDSLAIVAWNVEGGHGDLLAFLDDLQRGRITGAPVIDFVLLLQETFRGGEAVPAVVPAGAATARRVGYTAIPARYDIGTVAAWKDLSLIYVPSKRNGHEGDPDPEDRGNAILSTLPLSNILFVELPFERHRMVSPVAEVAGTTSGGSDWTLRLASVHLEHVARLSRFHRSFGAARARQARALVAALEGEQPTVVGGDFNNWEWGGQDARTLAPIREAFPRPTVQPEGATFPLPGILPGLAIDHLFFRVPDEVGLELSVLPWTWGSDHHPVLGWVHFGRRFVADTDPAPLR